MSLSKEQIVHDLAMACVNGVLSYDVAQKTAQDSKSESLDIRAFARDAFIAYKSTYSTLLVEFENQKD